MFSARVTLVDYPDVVRQKYGTQVDLKVFVIQYIELKSDALHKIAIICEHDAFITIYTYCSSALLEAILLR